MEDNKHLFKPEDDLILYGKIYGIYVNDKLSYIGKTTRDLGVRLKEHKNDSSYKKKFEILNNWDYIIEIKTIYDVYRRENKDKTEIAAAYYYLDTLEQLYINRFKPSLNNSKTKKQKEESLLKRTKAYVIALASKKDDYIIDTIEITNVSKDHPLFDKVQQNIKNNKKMQIKFNTDEDIRNFIWK